MSTNKKIDELVRVMDQLQLLQKRMEENLEMKAMTHLDTFRSLADGLRARPNLDIREEDGWHCLTTTPIKNRVTVYIKRKSPRGPLSLIFRSVEEAQGWSLSRTLAARMNEKGLFVRDDPRTTVVASMDVALASLALLPHVAPSIPWEAAVQSFWKASQGF